MVVGKQMARAGLILLMILATCLLSAQNLLSLGAGASGTALGNIKSVQGGVIAMYGNEAALGFSKETAFYATAERRFGNEGLNFYSVVGAYATTLGGFGATVQYFGFDAYNEFLAGVAYGRRILEGLSLGIQFDYLQARIPGYGKKSALLVELGIQSHLSKVLKLGFHVYNPFQINWVEQEILPMAINFGLSYLPSEKVLVLTEVEKVTDQKENLKFGLQYKVMDSLSLRLGVNTYPSLFCFGIGYGLGRGLKIDVCSTVHQQLGVTPLAGIGYTKSNGDP